MNAPVLIRIGQRFISGIHDGPILLHPFEEIIHDIIGTLGELKRKERFLRIAVARASRHDEPVHLNPGVLGTRRTDTSRSRKYLSGDQEGHKGSKAPPCKGEASRDE